jgi:hypothetical protein
MTAKVGFALNDPSNYTKSIGTGLIFHNGNFKITMQRNVFHTILSRRAF